MRFANTAMSLRPLYALRSLPPPTPLSPSEAAAAASGSFALGMRPGERGGGDFGSGLGELLADVLALLFHSDHVEEAEEEAPLR